MRRQLFVPWTLASNVSLQKWFCRQQLARVSLNDMCVGAMEAGYVDAIVYLHSYKNRLNATRYTNPFACHLPKSRVPARVSVGGLLACTAFCNQAGIPWTSEIFKVVARSGSLECLMYANANGACMQYIKLTSSFCNTLPSYVYAVNKGIRFASMSSAEAAATGSVESLAFVIENGGFWGHAVQFAVAAMSFACLVYAFRGGAIFDYYIAELAAKHRSAMFLQYLHRNGCQINSQAMWGASIECLDFLVSHDLAEKTVWVCRGAAGQNSLACLRYAVEHGFPFDAWAAAFAISQRSMACFRFLCDMKCPWNEYWNLLVEHQPESRTYQQIQAYISTEQRQPMDAFGSDDAQTCRAYLNQTPLSYTLE